MEIKTPGQVAYEAYRNATAFNRLALYTWDKLPDDVPLAWEAAARAVLEMPPRIDPKIRAVAEKALADAREAGVPGARGANFGWVELAADDLSDITRRVYITRTFESPELHAFLSDRLKAQVENGGDIEIRMEW